MKVLSSILVKELLIVADVRFEHSLNANDPIFVTEFGITIEVS